MSLEDFLKLGLRIAKVVEVKDHPNAQRLYVLKVDDGERERTLVAGLKAHYSPEELLGRLVVVATGLQPKEIRGVVSEGMLLAALSGEKVSLLTPDTQVSPGTEVR